MRTNTGRSAGPFQRTHSPVCGRFACPCDLNQSFRGARVSIGDRPFGSSLRIRLAEPDETDLVRDIDDRIFPPDNADLQRAPAGELEEAVEAKDVFLFSWNDHLVGYLHVDRSHPDKIYISGFGVLPERQNLGLGGVMVAKAQELLQNDESERPIYTVTSPRNSRMLRLLFHVHFAGRWVLPDFFGRGRHRIGCQLLQPGSRGRTPLQTALVRVSSIHQLDSLVDDGWLIRGLRRDPAGPFFELSPAGAADFLECARPQLNEYATAIRPQSSLLT